ncbi:MAG: serine/threonine-protein kinase [Dokdonella sp.]
MNDASANLRALFDAALAIAPEARVAWLAANCVDADQRKTIERLLAADTASEHGDDTGIETRARPLDSSFDRLLDAVGEPADATPPIGTTIGPFRLLDQLGEGGSSIVFRATREQAGVSQQVALKLLRRNLYTQDEHRRFRDERRALTQLQHPGIARLIEGGVTDIGTPYIALELIDGVTIVDYVREQQLDLDSRLRLFIDVCRAVEAAHRALIVHRDLKPSNVLVTANGEVKLLDFGIAKLLDSDDEDQTSTQHVPMTPAYAAPEQFARGQITTATDVYALGILLGELITGQRHEPGDSRTPSAQVTDTSANQTRIATARALRRKLRGDLDNIVLKATATKPELRYASAGAFADDIARHLQGQPVIAHPPSRMYRARKFVGRHRGGVVTTVLFLIAILASLGVALWQGQVARNEAQRATSVRDFLLRVFSAAEPAGPRIAPPSVVDIVRLSVTEAQQSKTLNASVRIELLEALGNVLREQGQLDESVALLDADYRDATNVLGPSHPITLRAGMGLARALADAGKQEPARNLLDTLLPLSARVSDPELRSRLLSASALLAIDRFERERAFTESAQAVELCKQDCTEPARIFSLLVRGNVFASFQEDAAAIPILTDALAAQRIFYVGPHVDIADTEQNLSRAYRRQGQFDRAEALAREALATVEASVPDPHERRSSALDTLRQVLIDTRQFDEAEKLGLRLIAMDKATLGPDHPSVATSENTLGFTYLMASDSAQAAEHFRAALAISERIPDNQRRSAIYRSNLGVSIGRNGDPATGMQMIHAAIAALRALPEPDYDQICSALEKIGALQRFTGDANASVGSYSEALAIYKEKLPDAPKAWRVVSLVGLGRAHLELGNNSEAGGAFREALANETTPLDKISPDRIEAHTGLAAVMHGLGNDAEAKSLLMQAQSERTAAQGRLSPTLQAFIDGVAASISAH